MTATGPARRICDYEGSSYQADFWDTGERTYEDRAEAIALRRLLPASGRLLLELGAGAGRNTPRYAGFERVVLLDYSRSQLRLARQRLGSDAAYTYVAADIYRLPFAPGLFDAATMIRVIHHLADAPAALRQVRAALQPGAAFVLEFANKQNLAAILRYWSRRQTWNPFSPEPIEFAELNFDFHPRAMRRWLGECQFQVRRVLSVSHFRLGAVKKRVPTPVLAWLDSLLQPTGAWFQFTPSVFVRAEAAGPGARAPEGAFFRCPACGGLEIQHCGDHLHCRGCDRRWPIRDGIYDFKEPG